MQPTPLSDEVRRILHEFLEFAYLNTEQEKPLPGNGNILPIVVYNACAYIANIYAPGFSQNEVYALAIKPYGDADDLYISCSSRYPASMNTRDVVEAFLRKRKLATLGAL